MTGSPGEWKIGDTVHLKELQVSGTVLKVLPEVLGGSLQVYVEGQGAVWCTPTSLGRVLEEKPLMTGPEVAHQLVRARLLSVLSGGALISPMEGLVTPLPHQVFALSKTVRSGRPRMLLADEVGLGKTIEAGLVVRELMLRGEVKRVLILTPKSLALQWVAEMQMHFQLPFELVNPSTLAVGDGRNPWLRMDRVVVTQDSVKPLHKRTGWTAERIQQHNQSRFVDLVTAGWDLVVMDEAHRMAGGSQGVARHELAAELARTVPRVLLLTATPHSGKSEGFLRLMQLLEPESFPAGVVLRAQDVQPFVVRTEKRQAVDMHGKPLFSERHIRLRQVPFRTELQEALYREVSAYVTTCYNLALREGNSLLAYLLLLMQRLVSSSTRAIHQTLSQRLTVLQARQERLNLKLATLEEEDLEMDGEALRETLIHLGALTDTEVHTVEKLVGLAAQVMGEGLDSKARVLLEVLGQLEEEFSDPELKVLIFTEFRATQDMLRQLLEGQGHQVSILNGTMDLDGRRQAQLDFKGPCRFMVATDAGGEGLNLQFAHVVINYDLPWNPMRVEQRIGRVDRIGQTRPVVAVNLMLDSTAEARVLSVIEQKLQVIQAEFGVDKTSDVLNSTLSGKLVESLYARRLEGDQAFSREADAMTQALRELLQQEKQHRQHFPVDQWNTQEVQGWVETRIPVWVRKLVQTSVTSAKRDPAEPQGHLMFSRTAPGAPEQVTLEHPVVKRLLNQPFTVPEGMRWAKVHLDLGYTGHWALFGLKYGPLRSFVPLFRTAGGKVFKLAGQEVWDHLLQSDALKPLPLSASQVPVDEFHASLREHAQQIRHTWHRTQEAHLHRLTLSHTAQVEAAGRIGIPNIRHARLQALERRFEQRKAELMLEHPLEVELLLGLEVGP